MTKIVLTNPMGLSIEQEMRIKKLGDVTFYKDMPSSPDEWLRRCQGYDVVCSWIVGLREKYGNLKNVLISVPFVGVSSFADPIILKANNITLCNSPGSNKHAVSEWIIYMILTTMRQLGNHINTTKKLTLPLSPPSIGLKGKNISILGRGNVGKRVGVICEAFEMNVTYFVRGEILSNVIENADIIVDTLSANPSSKGLLNKDFFKSVKKGAIFISVTVDSIVDMDAMLLALDEGRLSYVAHDVMNAKLGDATDPLYERLRKHPNVYATPHISAFTDVTSQIGNDMMIANIEAWLQGKPINVFSRY